MSEKYKVIDRRGEREPEESPKSPAPVEESQPIRVQKFECFFDRILVLPDPDEDARRVNSIYVAGEDVMRSGEVRSVGPGRYDHSGDLVPMSCCIGDRILFGKWAGSLISVNGVEFVTMRDGEVFGRVHFSGAHG